MQRFEDIKNKVERTRQTLTEAAERARKHEELKSTIDELKARTEKAIVYKESLLTIHYHYVQKMFNAKERLYVKSQIRMFDEAMSVLSCSN